MLTGVKNLLKITFLSTKYAIMKEMENKVSFFMNVFFMILNNASFLLVWIVIYSLKDNINGYSFNTVLLLWAIGSGTYGVSHAFFKGAYSLSTTVVDGKLDAFLVMPKSVLIQSILGVSPSAFGDILYGYIVLAITGITPYKLLMFTLFIILGGILQTCVAIFYGSLSFWLGKVDQFADTFTSLVDLFGTYPDSIFNRFIHIIFFTIVPVAFIIFIPVKLLVEFNIYNILLLLVGALIIILIACITFKRGLKRYSSSNLMIARL